MEYIPLVVYYVIIFVPNIISKINTGEFIMDDNIYGIITTVAAVLTPIVTLVVGMKKISGKIDKLGNFEEKPLKAIIEDDLIKCTLDNELMQKKLGIYSNNPDDSLSKQHEKILHELVKREEKINEELNRLGEEPTKAYETSKAVSTIIDDWVSLKNEQERLLRENKRIVEQNNKLQEELTQLSDDNRKLQEELKSVKAVSRKMSNEPKKKNNVQSGSYDIPADDLNESCSRGR